MDMNIEIVNLPEIRAAFSSAPRLMRTALPKAINKSLLLIGTEADKNLKKKIYDAPISKSGYKRTGNLISSVLDPTRGLKLAGPGEYKGYVGSGTNYGIFVEMGTRFMAAKSYLRPAVESTGLEVQTIFKEAVQGVLNKIGEMT